MARKKQEVSGKREKIVDFRRIVWVVNNVNEGTLEKIDAQPFDVERSFDAIEGLIDAGIDVKFSFDAYSDCYQVTLIGAWAGFPNAGYALSARSNDSVLDALKLALGKFFLVCDGDMKSQAHVDKFISRRG